MESFELDKEIVNDVSCLVTSVGRRKILSPLWEHKRFSLSHARDKTKNIFLQCRVRLLVLSLVEKHFI